MAETGRQYLRKVCYEMRTHRLTAFTPGEANVFPSLSLLISIWKFSDFELVSASPSMPY